MTAPTFKELIPTDNVTISQIQRKATETGYELLKLINSTAVWDKTNGNRYLQIATSESLTCGLIMATLVDIPWAGFIKYGGFGVYDPDAKRVFNHVSVDDVYTHKCASEMAIGILKNSNATLAIAVTGNAMPLNDHVDMLGEVFIGIAGYNAINEIIYETTVVNMCTDPANEFPAFKETCQKWHNTIKVDQKFNPRTATATISKEIRYYTVYKAYQQCINFIKKHSPSVPDEILERKKQNDTKSDQGIHTTIPNNKFEFGGEGKCVNNVQPCNLTGDRTTEDNNALYIPPPPPVTTSAGTNTRLQLRIKPINTMENKGTTSIFGPLNSKGGKKSKKNPKNKRSFRLRSYKRH